MTYKQIINKDKSNIIDYRNVKKYNSGFIVGRYDKNIAYVIISNDWYLIDKDRIYRNSSTGDALNYIFNSSNEKYDKDTRYYTNLKQALSYIIDIVYN